MIDAINRLANFKLSAVNINVQTIMFNNIDSSSRWSRNRLGTHHHNIYLKLLPVINVIMNVTKQRHVVGDTARPRIYNTC